MSAKVCIVGAGAIGGLIGARIAAQNEVSTSLSLLARGQTLQALRHEGLRLYYRDVPEQAAWSHVHCHPVATDDAASLGIQDLIVLSVKYNGLAALAPRLKPLLGPKTVVLSAMNGIPWWFGLALQQGPQLKLEAVDPGGAISDAIDPASVLGCVVHLAASARAPGQIQLNMGNRLVIGEPTGQTSQRMDKVCRLLEAAGFDLDRTDQIGRAIWYKLWGNMTMNPISALTGAQTDAVLADDQLRGFMSMAMTEANEVGIRLGLGIDELPEQRHTVTRKLGGFRTSMLQDLQAGKPLEIDALITVVSEIASQVNVSVPAIDGLLGLIRVFEQTRLKNGLSA